MFFVLVAPPTGRQSAIAAPARPPDLLAGTDWLLASQPGDADYAPVAIAGAPGDGPQLRITIHHAQDPYYRIQLSHEIPTSVPDGDLVRYHFWGRSATNNRIRAVVEQALSPWKRVIDGDVRLTSNWKEYSFLQPTPGYGPSGLAARMQVGQSEGTVELSSVTVQDMGPDPEMIAAEAAVEPAAIAQRIQQYRMADLTVAVFDAQGHLAPDATVSITQTRHSFLFGCNIFGLSPPDTRADQTLYQQRFAALFNYATLPFYWGSFEPQQGKPQFERLDAMVDWCLAHGITCKGHPLVWHQGYPSWAAKDPGAAQIQLHARVTDIINHYKGKIGYWDVLNEANGASGENPPNGESSWIAQVGPAAVVATALGWAREAGAGARETFLYNDYDTGDNNLALLQALSDKHSLPDVIGLQSHMHGGKWPMTKLWVTCRRFARFGLPIHFTETTVLSGPQRPIDYNASASDWLTTPEDEARQADYVAQFYSLLFSDPNVRAITWWDLSDKNAWLGAPAGLIRRDMSPKPAYERLMTLIHKDWWTNATLQTNSHGDCKAHVFYGDYTITVTDKSGHSVTQTITLPEAGGPRHVDVKL